MLEKRMLKNINITYHLCNSRITTRKEIKGPGLQHFMQGENLAGTRPPGSSGFGAEIFISMAREVSVAIAGYCR